MPCQHNHLSDLSHHHPFDLGCLGGGTGSIPGRSVGAAEMGEAERGVVEDLGGLGGVEGEDEMAVEV